MWIELISKVGEHPAGKFLEVEDSLGRGYIAAGLAKDGGDGPDVVVFQRAIDTFRTEMRSFVEGTAKAITDATAGLRARPPVLSPGANGSVYIGESIVGGEAEADKRRSAGGFVKDIVLAQAFDDKEAHTRLVTPWSEGGYGAKANGVRTMTEGSGAAGGFTTPVLYESAIFKVAAQNQIIVPAATQVPLGARETYWPALNQFSTPAAGQSALFGGMQVYRKGETLHRTESDLAFKYVKTVAQDLTAYTEISRDLIQDSMVSIDGLVTENMGKAIGWREDWESYLGNGLGQFLGIMNAAATLQVTRNTNNKILYQDVFTMPTRLWQPEAPCWICHPFTIYSIWTLQDPSTRFIFVPNAYVDSATSEGKGGATLKLAGTLLGWPIYTSEWAPPLGSVGDLALVDRRKYMIGRRGGLEIGVSEHFKFDQDEIAIRSKIRNDGQPWMKAPITLADGTGTNQVSSFVILH